MRITRGGKVLELVRGDITEEETDAIVNAANRRLAGGGGVDGAIHRAGGPGIMAECRRIGGCPTGKAVITTGGNLKAKHVIHAVGPVYRGGGRGEPELLRSAYRESLKLAAKSCIKSVSFPSISTGAYGYPVAEAAEMALREVVNFLEESPTVELVRFVLFSEADLATYEDALRRISVRPAGLRCRLIHCGNATSARVYIFRSCKKGTVLFFTPFLLARTYFAVTLFEHEDSPGAHDLVFVRPRASDAVPRRGR